MVAAVALGLDTPARRSLAEWLEAEEGRSQVLLASWVGINSSSVSLWVSGRSRPDHAMRVALRLLLGVPEDAWFTDEERALIERARTLAASLRPKRRRSVSTPPPSATGKHPRGTFTRTGTEG